jgi:hypothetical protein
MKKEKFDDIVLDFIVSNDNFTDFIPKKLTVSLVNFENTIQFETKIPDYLYNEAVKQFPDIYDQAFLDEKTKEEVLNYGTKQQDNKAKSKIIRSPLLNELRTFLYDLSSKINIIYTFKDDYGEKMLFIYFKGDTSIQRDGRYGGNMGLLNSLSFQYFTAFYYKGVSKKLFSDEFIEIEKYNVYYKCGLSENINHSHREKELKPLHNTEKELIELKNKYLIIPWTEEREEYLKDIQVNFINMTDKLNVFLKNLTETKLDFLIENKPINKLLAE